MIFNKRGLTLEGNGSVPTSEQDQTSPVLIIPMLQPLATTTITATLVFNSYTIEIADATGININDLFRVIDVGNNRFLQGSIINLIGTTVTIDTPIDFAYAAGSEFATGNPNMAVNGSVTPVVFKLRIGTVSVPGVADINRMIMVCETNTAVDLNKFGDLATLPRGINFRTSNGVVQNIFLVKSNRGLAGIAYDWTPYSASNPAQGIDGFSWRLTFNGQDKLGVALRVEADGNLEMWVQDDLTSLVSLTVVLEGHVLVD